MSLDLKHTIARIFKLYGDRLQQPVEFIYFYIYYRLRFLQTETTGKGFEMSHKKKHNKSRRRRKCGSRIRRNKRRQKKR